MTRICLAVAALILTFVANWAAAAPSTIRSAVGADAAAIQAAVDAFRADLGANNGVGPLGLGLEPGVGRREINWDAVPDAFSSGGANPFPGNFFNLATGNPAGRVRGALFATTGAFEVSADADSDNDGLPGPTATLFGNRHPDNPADFAAFSAERIFGLLGTNEMDVFFNVPGSPGVEATVRGFGAVFTDVEAAGLTKLDYYDVQGNLLHSGSVLPFVLPQPDTGKSFSFFGATFSEPIVHRVHITAGGYDLALQLFGPPDPLDAVAMDDFIYGEPKAVPEPATALLALIAVPVALAWRRRGAGRACRGAPRQTPAS